MGDSRKTADADITNLYEIRRLCESARKWKDGVYVIKDEAGRVIAVDIKNGITALIENKDGKLVESKYQSGESSSKKNGYVYTRIAIKRDESTEIINYGTHSLVAMIAHKEEFDKMAEELTTPIANHKNNRKWDNRAENLEWISSKANRVHGKIVNSLHRNFRDVYTHIEYNLGGVPFVVLNKELSVKDIYAYLKEIRNPGEFECERYEYIDDMTLGDLLVWLGWREDAHAYMKKYLAMMV